jgi:hypothetical protein
LTKFIIPRPYILLNDPIDIKDLEGEYITDLTNAEFVLSWETDNLNPDIIYIVSKSKNLVCPPHMNNISMMYSNCKEGI